MFKIGSSIKKEQVQLVRNGDIMEIWLTENGKELDSRLWKMESFTQESSKMISHMEKGFTSGHLEMFMKEIEKMEQWMEWESSSTSEKNGDTKVSTKMTKEMEMESSIKKMEPFTLEVLKKATFMDLDHSTQLMGKRSSNVVSGKMTNWRNNSEQNWPVMAAKNWLIAKNLIVFVFEL
jgi:hypothetical protein